MWYDATSAAGSLEDPSGQQGRRQGRLRAGAGARRPRPRAGCGPGPGRCRRPPRRPTPRRSSCSGPPARTTRSWSATSSAGRGSRPASGRAPTRSRSTRRPPPRSAPATLQSIEEADPVNPGVQPRPDHRRAVRRHPGVPGPRHQGVPGHRRRDRRTRHRRRRADQGSGRSPRRSRRTTSSEPAAQQPSTGAGRTARPPAPRRPAAGHKPAAPGGTMSVQSPAKAPATTADKRGKQKPPGTMSRAERWRRRGRRCCRRWSSRSSSPRSRSC